MRWCREGLLEISSCQQAAGEWAVGCPSETPVGTKLISTLPHLTFRQEEIAGSSGRTWDMADVRRWEVAKSASHETPGPANTTKFPLGVHLAVDTQTLVWVGSVESAALQALTRTRGARAALVRRVDTSM